jgi:bifunctional non-homologous end joining protein LigD
MRVNQGQEFVIGGYTVGGRTLDALIFGYYEGGDLIYVARTRNGFTPRTRENLLMQMRKLEVKTCPFRNLPEPRGGRWGQGLTAEKMKNCVWSNRSWSGSSNLWNGRRIIISGTRGSSA